MREYFWHHTVVLTESKYFYFNFELKLYLFNESHWKYFDLIKNHLGKK